MAYFRAWAAAVVKHAWVVVATIASSGVVALAQLIPWPTRIKDNTLALQMFLEPHQYWIAFAIVALGLLAASFLAWKETMVAAETAAKERAAQHAAELDEAWAALAGKDSKLADHERTIQELRSSLQDATPVLTLAGFPSRHEDLQRYAHGGSGAVVMVSGGYNHEYLGSPWRPYETVHASFVQVAIRNASTATRATSAQEVGASLTFIDEMGAGFQIPNARWSDAAAPSFPQNRAGIETTEIAPGRTRFLDVAFAEIDSDGCFAIDNQSVTENDWRQDRLRLRGERFAVHLDVRGKDGVCLRAKLLLVNVRGRLQLTKADD